MACRVLIVDDSMLVRRQVSAALSTAGYEVVEAVDGLDASQKVTTDLALIVSDLNMPKMNGIELLELIRKDSRNASIPFVMLTTEMKPAVFERAKELGAKAWLLKPFKADLFLAAISKLAKAA
ncbi:MAG TPA: response regulator [Kofleriaceae bacterium]|jgi:two-component system chemotaxis response regulator CheY